MATPAQAWLSDDGRHYPTEVDALKADVAHWKNLFVGGPPTPANRAILDRLTKREREVLMYAASGMATKMIGKKLCISPKTVDNHRTSMMRKVGVHNIAGAINFAYKVCLVTP